jgi:hypothetical protein
MSDSMTYDRRSVRATAPAETPAETPQPEAIRVDGFAQIVAMLQVADADFRESLLRRLALRDPTLADNLRRTLRSRY